MKKINVLFALCVLLTGCSGLEQKSNDVKNEIVNRVTTVTESIAEETEDIAEFVLDEEGAAEESAQVVAEAEEFAEPVLVDESETAVLTEDTDEKESEKTPVLLEAPEEFAEDYTVQDYEMFCSEIVDDSLQNAHLLLEGTYEEIETLEEDGRQVYMTMFTTSNGDKWSILLDADEGESEKISQYENAENHEIIMAGIFSSYDSDDTEPTITAVKFFDRNTGEEFVSDYGKEYVDELNIIPIEEIEAAEEITLTTEERIICEYTLLPKETNQTVTITSSDETVVDVVENEILEALMPGGADVTITAESGAEAVTHIIVHDPIVVESISINGENSIIRNQTAEFIVEWMPEEAEFSGVTWESSDKTVLTIDENGIAEAVSLGIATIKAIYSEEIFAEMQVEVLPVEVSKLMLSKSSQDLIVGKITQLTCTYEPADADVHDITWSSSNANVASVDNNGLITAVAVGDAVITAKCGNIEETCQIHVNPIVVRSITLSIDQTKLVVGETVNGSVKYSPENAADKTTTWSSSDTSVATVNNNGVIKALKPGKTKITAECNEKTSTLQITVTEPKLTSISLYGTNWSNSYNAWTLYVNNSMNTSVHYSPENTEHGTVTYSSSNEKVAKVDSNGVVTGVSAGSATITAECDGKVDTIDVQVNTPVTRSASTSASTSSSSGAMVWIPKSGSKYHRSASCSNMKNPSQVTLEQAEAWGYTPCKKCY